MQTILPSPLPHTHRSATIVTLDPESGEISFVPRIRAAAILFNLPQLEHLYPGPISPFILCVSVRTPSLYLSLHWHLLLWATSSF